MCQVQVTKTDELHIRKQIYNATSRLEKLHRNSTKQIGLNI
jgi:hypothetical protein